MSRYTIVPLLLALTLSLIFVLFILNAIALSFARLGLTPGQAFVIFASIILGSYINVPVSRKKIILAEDRWIPFPFFYRLPKVAEQVIFVNVGGAIIPTMLSFYFLPRSPLIPALAATLIVVIISKFLARPVPGVGITMPALVPPVLSAITALILAPENPAPVAYISGVLGTLIGADLLNLGRIREIKSPAVSIGGAGVFDGVFLVGIIAVLLT